MTWTLDYDKTSDFDDVTGHWHVVSLGGPKSRVYYACDIQMSGPVPTPLLNYIGKAALKKATAWVKRESEAHPDLKHKYTPQTTTKSSMAASSTNARGGGADVKATDKLTHAASAVTSRIAKFLKPKLAFLQKI